jgi:hypothetical protein
MIRSVLLRLHPSILIRSPINLGPAFTHRALFFSGARVNSRSSFLGGSPVSRYPFLTIAHGLSPLAEEIILDGAHYR